MVIHHTLLAKSTDSTWPAISLAIGSSKSQISTIHHNLQSSHIITFHCQSVPVAIAREKTLKSGSKMSKKGYYGSIPSTICGGWNVMNECWVKTTFYQLFNYSLCLPNVEWILVNLPTCYHIFFFTSQGHQKGPDQLALEHPHGELHDGFWKWNGSWYVLENSGKQYIYWDISYQFYIKLYIYVTRIDHKSILYDMGMDQYLWKYHF